jgi:uncharacterized protein YjiS (DUF1127 family)
MSTARLQSSYATLAAPVAIRRGDGRAPVRWHSVVMQAVDLVLAWHERARQRRQLQSLNDYMLKDLGLSRADVEGEAQKPFWRV